MLVRKTALPAYNVQTAVDAEHALIVAHAVVLEASHIRCLRPMAEAAKRALQLETFNVVADAGYSNGKQVAHCEAVGMMPHVPVMRTVKKQGDGTLYRWRGKPRLGACVQRDFREQEPRSADDALYIVYQSL